MLVIVELLITRPIRVFSVHPQVVGLGGKIVIGFASCLLLDTIPDSFNGLLVVHPLEDAIAANQEEVEVWFELEALYLWFTDDDVRITSVLGTLCFNVSESSRD